MKHILQKHTKETLVSKTTVAKLVLPLKDISWNMKSLDFSWNKAKPLKVETALGLKVSVDCYTKINFSIVLLRRQYSG